MVFFIGIFFFQIMVILKITIICLQMKKAFLK